MLESCNQRNGLNGMMRHHHSCQAVPFFSAFDPRSPSRTRLPIATFLSPLVSSFGIISRSLSKVSSVDFQQDDSQGNPVLAYLQRHGTAQGLTTPLANGYSLNTPDVSTTFNARFDQQTVLENIWRPQLHSLKSLFLRFRISPYYYLSWNVV